MTGWSCSIRYVYTLLFERLIIPLSRAALDHFWTLFLFAFRFAARAIWRYGLLVYAVVVACALALLLRTHSYDDPFITFRYAQNLATSQGFVYNPGVRVLSTTSPLYALILVIPAWLGWSLPVVGNIMGCVAVALGGAAWWQLGQRWQQPVVGAVGAALYPILPLVVPTVGSETPLYLAALL